MGALSNPLPILNRMALVLDLGTRHPVGAGHGLFPAALRRRGTGGAASGAAARDREGRRSRLRAVLLRRVRVLLFRNAALAAREALPEPYAADAGHGRLQRPARLGEQRTSDADAGAVGRVRKTDQHDSTQSRGGRRSLEQSLGLLCVLGVSAFKGNLTPSRRVLECEHSTDAAS